MKTIDPKEVSTAEFHSYLLSSVAPRPIAFASTTDREGNVNLSPFSFFNAFGSNPPTLVFSPNKRVRDNSGKDTLNNVYEVDEVVINMVDYSMVEQVSLASCEYPRGVNEFIKAGFTPVSSVKVKPPRVAESKVAFECRIRQIVSLGDQGGAPNLVICEVLLAHVSEELLDENGRIDPLKTDWVARMGGDWYCRASGEAVFEVAKPNVQVGVGVDCIPAFIRDNPLFTGNDLGRLGNIHRLPDSNEVGSFKQEHASGEYLALAKQLLEKQEVRAAWCAILALQYEQGKSQA
ncbi:flavin reductase family protein [Leadbetterella sp. DM7]|uniref:flavin reductase family protein n=1 Tax=Leadbetterella sp. DM7 TaxID=3235085 RepID=UPI00349ED4A9